MLPLWSPTTSSTLKVDLALPTAEMFFSCTPVSLLHICLSFVPVFLLHTCLSISFSPHYYLFLFTPVSFFHTCFSSYLSLSTPLLVRSPLLRSRLSNALCAGLGLYVCPLLVSRLPYRWLPSYLLVTPFPFGQQGSTDPAASSALPCSYHQLSLHPLLHRCPPFPSQSVSYYYCFYSFIHRTRQAMIRDSAIMTGTTKWKLGREG